MAMYAVPFFVWAAHKNFAVLVFYWSLTSGWYEGIKNLYSWGVKDLKKWPSLEEEDRQCGGLGKLHCRNPPQQQILLSRSREKRQFSFAGNIAHNSYMWLANRLFWVTLTPPEPKLPPRNLVIEKPDGFFKTKSCIIMKSHNPHFRALVGGELFDKINCTVATILWNLK